MEIAREGKINYLMVGCMAARIVLYESKTGGGITDADGRSHEDQPTQG